MRMSILEDGIKKLDLLLPPRSVKCPYFELTQLSQDIACHLLSHTITCELLDMRESVQDDYKTSKVTISNELLNHISCDKKSISGVRDEYVSNLANDIDNRMLEVIEKEALKSNITLLSDVDEKAFLDAIVKGIEEVENLSGVSPNYLIVDRDFICSKVFKDNILSRVFNHFRYYSTKDTSYLGLLHTSKGTLDVYGTSKLDNKLILGCRSSGTFTPYIPCKIKKYTLSTTYKIEVVNRSMLLAINIE